MHLEQRVASFSRRHEARFAVLADVGLLAADALVEEVRAAPLVGQAVGAALLLATHKLVLPVGSIPSASVQFSVSQQNLVAAAGPILPALPAIVRQPVGAGDVVLALVVDGASRALSTRGGGESNDQKQEGAQPNGTVSAWRPPEKR